MMQLILVTNCSATKTRAAPGELRAGRLPRGSAQALAQQWRLRRDSAPHRVRASNLYSGRAFAIAGEAAGAVGAELRVLSAGMGLLRHDSLVPPYSLTITPSATDCILDRAETRAPFSAAQWWAGIRDRRLGVSPFARLLRRQPSALLLIAVSRPYLEMIVDELGEIDGDLLDRVRIVGPKTTDHLAENLHSSVMPYDGRLNDSRFALRGTERDFCARAASHFLTILGRDRSLASAAAHARRVRLSLARCQAPVIPERTPLSSAELGRVIRHLAGEGYSRTGALRALRSDLGYACEEARFAKSWTTGTKS